MADLLVQARNTLLEGDRMSGATVDAGEGQLFCTGSGRSVSVSERAIRRARALVGEGRGEGCFCVSEQPFDDVPGAEGELRETDALFRGGVHNTTMPPVFQTGSGKNGLAGQGLNTEGKSYFRRATVDDVPDAEGESSEMDAPFRGGVYNATRPPVFQTGSVKAVLLGKDSIQKARVLLEDVDRAAGAVEPMFRTGMGRPVPVSRTSIDKARAALEGQTVAEKKIQACLYFLNNRPPLSAGVDGMEQFPLFQTGSGRVVSVSAASVQKAKSVLKDNSTSEENTESFGRSNQAMMFPTGSGRPAMISERSIERSRVVGNKGEAKKSGHWDADCQFPMFQTGLGKPVAVSWSSVQKARAVLEEEKIKTTVTRIEKNHKDDDHVPVVSNWVRWCPRHSSVQNWIRKVYLSSENSRKELPILEAEEAVRSDNPKLLNMDKKNSCVCVTSQDKLCKNSYSLASACNDKMENSTAAPKEGGPDLSKRRRASGRTELATFSHQAMSDRKHTGSFGNAAPDIPPTNESTNMFHVGSRSISEIPKSTELSSRCLSEIDNANDTKDKTQELHMPAGALVDISNFMGAHSGKIDHAVNEKRRIGGRNSASSFKRPRSSRFITPISINKQSSAGVPKLPPTQITSCRTKLSSSYPFKHKRKTWKEYFGGPPCFNCLTEHITDEVKLMDAKGAEKYKFHDTNTGAEEFQKMLLACGASLTYATKEWVNNHYKWIVWKLASLERCYPTKAAGKFLTVPNVLDELKYRYDREVNNGHRSAIKKILEGNALPSLMMVLCISAIYSHPDVNKLEAGGPDGNENSIDNKSLLAAKRNMSAHIELTDGWYALEASLDVALSEQLQKRKLSMGQKLRIWGASLCGWTGPVSFHEASGTVKLTIHVNGSYRARWDDPLGFCMHFHYKTGYFILDPPLAFKCIKASGGRVPRTLVGVARIYPVLYRERLPEGRSVVRSERMERKALQLYQQRVSKIAEDIMSEQDENCADTDGSEEGAKICKMLEQAAEPEVMMAGMTSEQILSFSSYQAKQKEARQNEVAKKVENALEVAGLSSRDVTPFLKVRVTSLVHRISATKTINKEGLITIWNPTEKQKADLVEGQVYIATGLLPSAHCTNILYLHARGSSTTWKSLTSAQAADFEPFFTPRKAVELSWIGEVPLTSEFDIAGVVLHVGDLYSCSSQKRQWLFLTDGSKFISASQSTEQDDYLLAVSFSCSTVGDDSAFFSYALSGNTVGFSNLVKRHKDQTRRIWVAEATASSTYTLSHEISKKSHLKEAATRAEKWASSSFDKIQQLKERVLCIIGDSGG
ncbi:Breast cancer type 2 susceptibility protein-like protein [Hordeum vulgare]|nr:Breast cancer type 2 susceptibility protein-like protein [Hordeum vulgare]